MPVRLVLFCFILFILKSTATAEPVQKTVVLGKPFKIRIPSENTEEIYLIAKIEDNYLSNSLPVTTSSERIFTFFPLKVGTTELSIDKITTDALEKDFISYRLKIEVPTSQERIKKELLKRKSQQSEDEKQGKDLFAIIVSLRKNGAHERAILKANQYIDQYPSGKYVVDVLEILTDMLHEKKQGSKAIAILQKHRKVSADPDAQARLILLLAKTYATQGEDHLSLETLLEGRAMEKKTKYWDQIAFELGLKLFARQKYQGAHQAFLTLYEHYKDKDRSAQFKDLDQALFRLAKIYELDHELRDMKQAYLLYGEMINQCPESNLTDEAKKRQKYLDRHFLSPR